VAVLVDTALLIDAERDGAAAIDLVAADEDRAISVITVSELLRGVHRARPANVGRRTAFVEAVIENYEPIGITVSTARIHARLWADLDAAGTPIGAHDLWIAATAIVEGFGVATRNVRDFSRVPGLRLVTVA
jgi:tRNA(fMet)-specific endonuclease VapC